MLRTDGIEIVNKDGKVVATLSACQDGAGLWITGPNGDLISIYSIDGQTAIGIYDEKGQYDRKGMNLALTLRNGIPIVQFRDAHGKAQFIRLADIENCITNANIENCITNCDNEQFTGHH